MNGLVTGLPEELQAELSQFVGRGRLHGRLQGQGRAPGDQQQKSPTKGSKEPFDGPKEPYYSKRALLSKAVRLTPPEVRRRYNRRYHFVFVFFVFFFFF
jgi:hypothetical protein